MLAKEHARWNKPYKFEQFPQMLYRAIRRDDGVVVVGDMRDERLDKQCHRTVLSEPERQQALEGGWRESPAEALALFEAKQRSIGEATAHRHYEDRNMSPAAQAEAAAADAATPEHVPEVKEAKRRGRPRKQAA
jgi:hypothetical protein